MKKKSAFYILLYILSVILITLAFSSCESTDDPSDDSSANKPDTPDACTHESYGEWTTVSSATCEQAGQKTRKCNNCTEIESETIHAIGHSFTNYVSNADASCEADGTKTATCDNGCQKTDTQTDHGTKKQHTGGEATCTTQKKCTVCLNPYGSTIPHKFENYVSNNDAKCSTDGTKTAFCEYGCGESSTVQDVGTATGVHSGGEATCSLPKKCSVCYEYYGQADPSKHSLSTSVTVADCVAPAMQITKCANCIYSISVELSPATGHSLSTFNVKSQEKVSANECKYKITLVGSCITCGSADAETLKYELIHEYVASISQYATCATQGVKSLECKNCDLEPHTQYYADQNAHTWVKNGDALNGVQAYKCSNALCTASKSVIELGTDTHTLDKGYLGGNELKLGNISLKLDTQTLGQLEFDSVTLSAKKLNASDRNNAIANLTADQKAQLGSSNVYDFTMLNASSVVDKFDGEITVTLPYQLNGADPDCVVVWYISNTGEVEGISATYSNGYVTFKTKHFSSYAVLDVDPSDACKINGHSYKDGETTVDATCISAGYTVKVCTRCNTSVAQIVSGALGHQYGAEPTKTEPTCTEQGEYIYTCARNGCGHERKVIVPVMHDFEYVGYQSATCVSDGYTDYKCTKCPQTKRTVHLKDEAYHELKYSYKLKDGARDCTGGVVRYGACAVDGCEYYVEDGVYFEHIPLEMGDLDQPIQPQSDTVSFNADFPELSTYNPYFNVSVTALRSTCPCGKAITMLEFRDEGNHFGSLSGTFIYAMDIPSENSEEVFTYSMGPMAEYKIAVCKRVEIEGCIKYYYVDVITNYGSSSEKTYTYQITSATNHVTGVQATLKKENTNCSDGIIVKHVCMQCGEVISQTEHYVQGSNHYYTYDFQHAIDISSYSSSGHKALIKEGRCPCGQSQYIVTRPNNVSYSQICNFVLEKTVTETDGTVKKVYKCSCGIRYMTAEKTSWILECTSRKYQIIYYGTYDAENNSFDKSTGLKTHVDTYSHQHQVREKNRVEIGTCYVERTVSYYCKYCSFEFPGFERNEKIYEHDIENTTIIDQSGNKTVTQTCKECGYVNEVRYDNASNLISDHSVTVDPKNERITVHTVYYTVIDGISQTNYVYKEIFTLDNQLISWEQTVYMYAQTNGIVYIYTVNSDGTTELEQLYM